MSIECYSCGDEYSRISTHWEMSSSCSHPSISSYQKNVLTGVLMGDGCIDTTSSNPRISCSNISKDYLLYLDKNFPEIGTGVKLKTDAESCAKRDRNSGFNKGANQDNYSDIFCWKTRCHPELREFANWYGVSGKEFPQDVEMTPTVLKHWFACDGSYDKEGKNNIIEIGVSNEVESVDKINNYFTSKGFNSPSWNVSERNDGSKNAKIYFDSQTTDELFKYMGEPLPGFEYKWKDTSE